MLPRLWACVRPLLVGFGGLVAFGCENGVQPAVVEETGWARPELWVVEQMPGGRVEFGQGEIIVQDQGGCTVWYRTQLTAPVEICYTATVVDRGGPFDRVSDLNCFWMASDPRRPDDLFAAELERTGAFADYDRLRTYYVGVGGNYNSTTRFRRYTGDGSRPLLPEHDLQDRESLLEGNRPYRITLRVQQDGTVEYLRDGTVLFRYRDPEPLREGWFGIRTVKSHLRITDFEVRPLR